MKHLVPFLLFPFLLAGCQGLGPVAPASGTSATPPSAAAQQRLPFPEPAAPAVSLDEKLLYDYLVGEIGARLGDLEKALPAYLEAARRASDPYAAERATRIAWHLGRIDAAAQAAALWVQRAPNSLAARQFLGLARLRQGRQEDALMQFRALLAIARARGKDGLLQVAGALAREPDKDRALALMRRLVTDEGASPRARYALAVLMVAQDRAAEAERLLRQVVEADPGSAEPYLLLARVLSAHGRRDEAAEVLARGVRKNPESRLLRTAWARQLVALERYDEALKQFRELARRSPNDPEILFGYAMLATQEKRWDEARPLWQKLRATPRFANEATYFLGQVEEASGHPETAIGLYRSIHRGELQVDAAIRAAALIAKDPSRLAEARRLLRQARKAFPKRAVDLYLAEAQLLAQNGADESQVLGLYAEALKAHPDDTRLLYARGLYRSETGDYKGMEADFRRVLALEPDDVDALNALGYMLAERNVRLQEALGYIRKALRLRPDSPAIQDSMGWVLYRLGRLDEALAYLKRAYAKDPDPEIAAHLVEVLWARGRQQEAQRLLEQALKAHPDDKGLQALRRRLQS